MQSWALPAPAHPSPQVLQKADRLWGPWKTLKESLCQVFGTQMVLPLQFQPVPPRGALWERVFSNIPEKLEVYLEHFKKLWASSQTSIFRSVPHGRSQNQTVVSSNQTHTVSLSCLIYNLDPQYPSLKVILKVDGRMPVAIDPLMHGSYYSLGDWEGCLVSSCSKGEGKSPLVGSAVCG